MAVSNMVSASSSDYVENIAIVGASGLVGGEILKNLLQTTTFKITVLSRQESTASFPSTPNLTVKKGSYSSSPFLESALENQHVLIITLAVTTPPEVQSDLIKAAAAAKVPWILPNEYGHDGDNAAVVNAVPLLRMKAGYRQQIEELGVSRWIGVACSMWLDLSLRIGSFGIDIPNRTAELYDDGETSITASTVAQTARAIVKLLCPPTRSNSDSSSLSLSDYANKYIYVNSFYISQHDVLASVQRATRTNSEDWKVSHKDVDDFIREGRERVAKGDRWGMLGVLRGSTFKKGLADRFHGREIANEKLGLDPENMDEVVGRVVAEIEGR